MRRSSVLISGLPERACVKVKAGHHFEHSLWSYADLRCNLTGSFQSHSQISEEDNIQNRLFLAVSVFSGSVAGLTKKFRT